MEEAAKYEVKGGNLIIHVGGDLDHHIAEEIRREADHLIDCYQVRNVVFDFKRATFMDSSGIGVIMGRYKKVHYMGGHVSVTGVTGRLEKIFRMSGLSGITDLCESVEECMKRH